MKVLFFFLAAIGSAFAGSPPGSPVLQVYTAKEIGAEATAWTATQNAEGLMLFGSHRLVSFDGEQWRHDSMGKAYALRSLNFGADGRLWAAACDEIGWFDPAPDGGYRFHSLRSSLPKEHADFGEAWYVFPVGSGAVFVSHDRVFRWDGARMAVWHLPGQRRLGAFAADGTVYVHHRPTGLLRLTPAGPEVAFAPEAIGRGTILWGERRGGVLIVASSQGFREERGGKFVDVAPEASAFIRDHHLTTVIALPDGGLAAGTLDGGIVLVAPDWSLTRIIDTSDGLPTNVVYGLYVDRDRSLWVTAQTHTVRIEAFSHVRRFDTKHGLPAGTARMLASTPLGILAATEVGVFGLKTSGKPNSTEKFELLSKAMAICVASDPQGAIVGRFGGIDLLTHQGRTQLLKSPDDAFVIAPSVLAPEKFFAAVGRTVIRMSAANPAAAETVVRDLPDLASSLAEDAQGRLWIGTTTRGLLLVDPAAEPPPQIARAPGTALGLPSVAGWSSVIKFGGSILVANSDGLFTWDHSRGVFQSVPTAPGSRLLAWAQSDSHGRLWTLMEALDAPTVPRYLAFLENVAGGLRWHTVACEGLSSIGEPRAIMIETGKDRADEVLWISGSGGILRVETARLNNDLKPRRPILHGHAVLRDGSTIPLAENLPASVNQIALRFSSMEYARRPGLRFQTQLESAGQTWTELSDRPVLQLPIPREGAYALSVRMLSADGTPGDPAVLRFSIAVPFWRTGLAHAAYAAAGLLLVYGLYRLRLRRLRAHAHRLERLVRERTAQLERADAAKTTFVAHLSHEIRNPINGILGASLALEMSPLAPHQSEDVKTVRHCSLFLSSLVEDVLDIIQLESGTIERRPAAYDPRALLGVVASVLGGQAQNAGVALTVASADDVPALVMGEAGRVQQILVNFTLNAIKFAAPGPVEVSLKSEAGWLLFAVADRGPGIPEAEKAQLFASFSRLNLAKKSGIAGSGLGLAVSRALASHLGGSVGVHARDGGGSVFWLRLALEPVAPALAPGAGTAEFVGARALIVEDVDYNAATLAFMLKRLGFRCDRACDADEALRMLREQHYDSVFVDYDLPGMPGPEFVRHAKAAAHPGETPLFIATTAYATTATRRTCLEAGMDAFVAKPITPDRLRDALLAFAVPLRAGVSVQLPGPGPLKYEILDYLAGDSAVEKQASRAEYVKVLHEIVQTMRDAIPAGRPEPARRAAHQLVGHARMVGAEPLALLAEQLEQKALNAPAPELAALAAEIEFQVRELTPSLLAPARTPTPG